MPETKKEVLAKILGKLKQSVGADAAAVVTRDGLLVASNLSTNVDGETLAAMTATMVGAAETAMSELKKKDITRVVVESKESKLISTGAGQTILVCMVNAKSNLGLALLEIKKAANLIKEEVEK